MWNPFERRAAIDHYNIVVSYEEVRGDGSVRIRETHVIAATGDWMTLGAFYNAVKGAADRIVATPVPMVGTLAYAEERIVTSARFLRDYARNGKASLADARTLEGIADFIQPIHHGTVVVERRKSLK